MNERISVLLVDDEPAVADLAALHLERVHEDITVEIEVSVEAALARFERDPETVDCIVGDYNMPHMNGLEFLTVVRETHPNIPYILFTGKGSEEIASEAISAGVTDYLQKGMGTEQYELLANRIENAVTAHRSERRATELGRINAVITDVQRELVRRSTREEIEESVCRCFAESKPYTLAWIGEPSENEEFVLRARAGVSGDYVDEITVRADDTPRGRGPVGTAFRTGEVQVTRNIAEDTAFEPWREVATRYGHESVIALPLTYAGTTYGVLAIYSNRRNAFDATERDALAELSRTVGRAIHATETRDQLERRERALAESERKYRSLIDAAPDALIVADADTGKIVETNAAAEALLGRSRMEIIGMHQSELHPEGETERYRELFERHVRSDGAGIARFEDGSEVFAVRENGEKIPVEISASIVEVGEQTLIYGLFRDVSAHREYERELREERAVTETIFDATPDSIYAFDVGGKMLRWNDEFAATVGYTDEEIAEMNYLEFVPEADREWILGEIGEIIEEDSTVTIESGFVTKAGEVVPQEFRGARLTDGEEVLGLIGTGRDVTERNRREEAIAALHEATRELVRAEDKKTVATATAEATEEILGFPITAVRLYDSDTDTLEPTAVADATARLLGDRPTYARGEGFPWRAFRSGEPVVVGGDGSPTVDDVPVRHRLYVPIGSHGTVSIASLNDAFDDTDIRLARMLAANAAVALDRVERTEQLQRYETITEITEDALYTLDTAGRFTFVNDAFCRLTGYESAEILGSDVALIKDSETVTMFEDVLRRMLSEDIPETVVEFEIETADGDRVPCEDHLAVRRPNGEFDGVAGAIRDVTARKERERELEDARARFRALAENTTLAVVTIDAESTIRYANEATNNVFGYRPAELVGESLTTLIPEHLHESHFDGIARYLREGTKQLDWEWIELPGKHREGHEMQLGVSFGEHVEDDEHRFTATIRDITEQKRHEQTIATLHDATREMMTAETRTEVARVAVETAEDVLGIPLNGVWLADGAGKMLRPAAQSARSNELVGTQPTLSADDSLAWAAFESGETHRYDHVDREPDAHNPETPIRSEILLPFGSHGLLIIGSTESGKFDESDVSLAKLLATNAEAALSRAERESELRRYERMLDAAGDMVYALDAEGRFTAVNDALVAETGYTREELLGEDISTWITAEDAERGAALIRGLLRAEAFESASDAYEITVPTTDGDAIPGEAQIALLRSNGTFEGSVGVVRDITARKEYERLLESLHDATREMMDAPTQMDVADVAVETAERVLDMPLNGIWFADENALRPVAHSKHGEELIGTPPTFTVGEGLAWEVFETGEARHYDRVDREPNALNPETPIRSEIIVPLSEYGIMTIGSVDSRQFDESDVSLAKLLAANTEAALNRAEREHQLVVEHDRLTALFENIPEATLSCELVDGEPIVKRANSRFEDVFGYPTETVLGESIDEFVVPPEHDAEATEFNEVLLRGETIQTTVRRQTMDGLRDFLLHVVPLELGERNVEGYAIYTDITDQKRRERDLERQNELLDGFASVISHDLRNPMSVVQGRLELAQHDCPSEHHEPAIEAIGRMNTLIEDVLTLARQGKVIGDTERVSLSTVAETAWGTAGNGTANLVVENLGEVEADRGRLTRLFENLFRNAVEHAGAEAEVVVGPIENGFFVADDGPGIPDGEREKIFEHGYSTAETGTGLGLMIVRSIAEAHGWDVRAEESEVGARFAVRTQ